MYGYDGYFTKEFIEYGKNILKMDPVKLLKELENNLGTETPMKMVAKMYYKYYSECGNMGTTVGG